MLGFSVLSNVSHKLDVLLNSNPRVFRCYFKKLTISTAWSWTVTTAAQNRFLRPVVVGIPCPVSAVMKMSSPSVLSTVVGSGEVTCTN